jgi:hypothetical protein
MAMYIRVAYKDGELLTMQVALCVVSYILRVKTVIISGTNTSMKIIIFWDIMQCSPLKVNRRYGVIYLLHLQG